MSHLRLKHELGCKPPRDRGVPRHRQQHGERLRAPRGGGGLHLAAAGGAGRRRAGGGAVPGAAAVAVARPEPDWADVERYRAWQGRLDVVMRQVHRASENTMPSPISGRACSGFTRPLFAILGLRWRTKTLGHTPGGRLRPRPLLEHPVQPFLPFVLVDDFGADDLCCAWRGELGPGRAAGVPGAVVEDRALVLRVLRGL